MTANLTACVVPPPPVSKLEYFVVIPPKMVFGTTLECAKPSEQLIH